MSSYLSNQLRHGKTNKITAVYAQQTHASLKIKHFTVHPQGTLI